MSTLGGGNGDGWPPEGGGQSDGLPGLPPEWGSVVIPDDPAELAEEAAQVRRELRRHSRRNAWRRRLGLPPEPRESAGSGPLRHGSSAGEEAQPSLGLPLLIMSIAVIATLTSLFAVAWPGRNNQSVIGPETSREASVNVPATETVPDLVLADAAGAAVRLTEVTPAALLLVDDCASCDDLVAATVAAAPDPVTVLVVGRTAPTVAPSLLRVRRLEDPQGRLRESLRLDPPHQQAAVVLVGGGGEVVRKLRAVEKVDTFRADLVQLT